MPAALVTAKIGAPVIGRWIAWKEEVCSATAVFMVRSPG
jgi:hypothetical protein